MNEEDFDSSVVRVLQGESKPFFATRCAAERGILESTPSCYTGSDNQILHRTLRACGMAYRVLPTRHLFNRSVLQLTSNSDDTLMLLSDVGEEAVGDDYGAADMANHQFFITEHRLAHFDFAYPLEQGATVMLVRAPAATQDIWRYALLPFAGFTAELYIVSLVLAVCLVALLAVIDVCVFRYSNPLPAISQLKGMPQVYDSRKSRKLVILAYGFLTVIFVGLYQKVLLTQMYREPTKVTMSSEELFERLESHELHLIAMPENNYFMEQIRLSNDSFYKRLRNNLQPTDHFISVESMQEAIQLVKTGNYVLPLFDQLADYYRRESSCELTFVELGSATKLWSTFLFSKRSRLDVTKFNLCLLSLHGYMGHALRQRELKRGPVPQKREAVGVDESKCLDVEVPDDGSSTMGQGFIVRPLSLASMLGGFLLLAVGLGMAATVFGVEMLLKSRRRHMAADGLLHQKRARGKHDGHSWRLVVQSRDTSTEPIQPVESIQASTSEEFMRILRTDDRFIQELSMLYEAMFSLNTTEPNTGTQLS